MGSIVLARGMDAGQLDAVATLEAACAGDGRLKLEWPALRSRPSDEARDLLWAEEGEVLGFLGLYRFGLGPLEITGMVDPRARRHGIGRSLLQAALDLPLVREAPLTLLVTDRRSEAGTAFAAAAGGVLHHSEHLMTLADADSGAAPEADEPVVSDHSGQKTQERAGTLAMRPAAPEDGPFVARLVRDAFGLPGHDDGGTPEPDPPENLQWMRVLEVDGEPAGVIRAEKEGGTGYIAGFVVEAARRGQGLGRAGLRLAVDELLGSGAWPISLEVETNNDRALGLYLDTGFEVVSTMDYFSLPRP